MTRRHHVDTQPWRGAAAATLVAAAIIAVSGLIQTGTVLAQSESNPDEQDANAVVQRMLEKREESPRLTPDRAASDTNAVAMPVSAVDIDRSVLGLAPGEEAPPLLRDGSFLIGRRGHLRPSMDGAHLLFVFESQAEQDPMLPMIVQPCALREDMEDYLAQRGDAITFIVTGQVFAYRGANYLLPTMMKIAIDRPNASQ